MGVRKGGAPMVREWCFENAAQAVRWSADVLRQRRCAAISPLWKEMVREEGAENGQDGGERGRCLLPRGGEDRMLLAVEVDGLVRGLGEMGMLLRAQAWGDWGDEEILRACLIRQEALRREGVRVVLRARYSLRQLGTLAGMSAPAVGRRVAAALLALDGRLRERRLL